LRLSHFKGAVHVPSFWDEPAGAVAASGIQYSDFQRRRSSAQPWISYAGQDGWRLSPAYDLNPVPTDVQPRILSTAITEDDNTPL
jgi:hypothetical protein